MALATFVFAGSFLSSLVAAQTPDNTAENHPKLTTYKCTTGGGCVPQNTALVLDASSHRIFQPNAPDSNCGDWGSGANATACPDEETCQQNCVLQGIPGKQLADIIPTPSRTNMLSGLHVLRKAIIAALWLAPHRIIRKLLVWFCNN